MKFLASFFLTFFIFSPVVSAVELVPMQRVSIVVHKFNTPSGELGRTQYAVREQGGWYIRTPANEIGLVDVTFRASDIQTKTEVGIICEDCLYYNTFLGRSGNIVREQIADQEYNRYRNTRNQPVPTRSELAFFPRAYADISVGANSNAGDPGNVSSFCYDHTTAAGSNLALVSQISMSDTTDGDRVLFDVTFNSVSLTSSLRENDDVNNFTIEQWVLANPDVGTYSLCVTGDAGAIAEFTSGSQIYYGVNQTTICEVVDGGQGNAQPQTNSITTTIDRDWLVGGIVLNAATAAEVSVTGGGTQGWEVDTGSAVVSGGQFKGPMTPPGTYTMSWTTALSARDFAIVVCALNPHKTFGDNYSTISGTARVKATNLLQVLNLNQVK
jgi:hypothetical protein